MLYVTFDAIFMLATVGIVYKLVILWVLNDIHPLDICYDFVICSFNFMIDAAKHSDFPNPPHDILIIHGKSDEVCLDIK